MRLVALVIITLLCPFVAIANSYQEIEKACKNAVDFQLCERAYQGLPPFPLSNPSRVRSTSSRGPIAIEVIPYVDKSNHRELPAKKRR